MILAWYSKAVRRKSKEILRRQMQSIGKQVIRVTTVVKARALCVARTCGVLSYGNAIAFVLIPDSQLITSPD